MRTFDEIRASFENDTQNPGIVEPGLWGATIHILETACRGVENRYQFLKALTGKTHSRDMTQGEQWALVLFVAPMKDELTKKWISRRGIEFEQEVWIVLAKASQNPDQGNLF